MLILLQHNVAHLGIVTGECLSEAATRFLPKRISRPILVTAIMAFVYGKKELAADPDNKKAKTGKTIGLVLIIINIVFAVIAIVALVALFGLAASM